MSCIKYVKIAALSLAVLMCSYTAPTHAQDSEAAENVPAVVQNDETYDERVKWASKMHDVKPTVETIGSVIDSVAMQLEPGSREIFKQNMIKAFDIEAVEQASVDAMVDTFTLPELKKMVEYSSSPEGKSIHEKMGIYQSLIQPTITKELDEAIVKLRYGE